MTNTTPTPGALDLDFDLDELQSLCDAVKSPWYGTYQIADGVTDEAANAFIEAFSPDTVSHLIAMARRAASAQPTDCDEPLCEQDWARVDAATAFHLIERHADDWDDAARMMEAWRKANTPERAAQPSTAEPLKWRFTGLAGLKRFMTDRQYQAQTPGVQRWYVPVCDRCGPAAAQPSAEKADGELSDAEIASLIGRCTRYEAEQDLIDLCRDAIAASRRAAMGKAMYQAQFDGEYGSSVWHDVTEAAYHTFVPKHRRIVYATPAPESAAQAEKVECARCKGTGGTSVRAAIEDGEHACSDCNGKGYDWEPVEQVGAAQAGQVAKPELTVWYGAMPESNGRQNYTAVLHRKDAEGFDVFSDGITIDRSEYPDRVRYEADRMRWLIGERAEQPEMWDKSYNFDKHSGYAATERAAAPADLARGWISVGDVRKPGIGEQVLLYVRTLTRGYLDDVPCEAEGAEIAMGEYRRGEDGNIFDCYTSPMGDCDWVTHWMPLPPAPATQQPSAQEGSAA